MKNGTRFGKEELDLLRAHRNGEAIEPIIRQSVTRKHAALGGQFSPDYLQANPDAIQNRSMIKIGG